MSAGPVRVASFYRFAPFQPAELPALRQRLLIAGQAGGVKGTVLLAAEGVNGTVSGPAEGVETLLVALRSDPRLAGLQPKNAVAPDQAFHRLKVRIKREIVTMGRPEVNPAEGVGTSLEPDAWDALISDPDTLVIDTRNAYEVAVGSFAAAIDPGTARFRDFPAWVERELAPLVKERRPKALALFCTGGIRCEKATAHLLRQGFQGVHQLRGGILNYLEKVPEARSLWRGECFVFDARVAVSHGLTPGSHSLCHACRMPLNAADRALPTWVEGVSCRHCHDRFEDADRRRFAERQRQVRLSRARGLAHLGPPSAGVESGGSVGIPDAPVATWSHTVNDG